MLEILLLLGGLFLIAIVFTIFLAKDKQQGILESLIAIFLILGSICIVATVGSYGLRSGVFVAFIMLLFVLIFYIGSIQAKKKKKAEGEEIQIFYVDRGAG